MAGWTGLVALVCCLLAAPASAAELRALFSPWDDIEGALISEIAGARQRVQVQAYLLTSGALGKALLAAHRRGVVVEVLADGEQAARNGKVLTLLAEAGVPVWLETRYAAAHNKILLIDGEGARPVLVTGSYNFTWSAQARNAENVLIVTGDKVLAQRYADNWRRHRREASAWRESIQKEQVGPHAR